MSQWNSVSISGPPAHEKYVVRRRSGTFVATPCYGMHEPWWVATTIDEGEADPIDIKDTDVWRPLIDV